MSDASLATAVLEIGQGLVDAHLGGEVIKKRVALPGRGKRAGARTLLALRRNERVFFVYGFAKSERPSISERELQALQLLTRELLNLSPAALIRAIQSGELIEVTSGG